MWRGHRLGFLLVVVLALAGVIVDVFVGSANGASAKHASVSAAVAAAEQALRGGEYEEALRRARGPIMGNGLERLGIEVRALVALGRYAEARSRLEGVVAALPDHLPTRDLLMRLDALVGDRES
ncbi:MAG TPA: hypothetical protein VG319_14135, partial [Polyangia bacterium]|nr:hypothetical protein [Polyangia bacterium]